MLLSGKIAIITGTNRGIGRALLETFAANGASIYAHTRTETAEFLRHARSLAEKHGVGIWPLFFDLTDYEAMKSAVREIMLSKRQVDILVNNAGITGEGSSFLMTPIDRMKSVYEVNFFAQMALTQYVARLMIRKKSGSIINISSFTALDGTLAEVEYASSKAALIGAAKKLSIELGEYCIRVNTIAPGVVDTDMACKIDDTIKNEIIRSAVIKRMATPLEIANAALFLASGLSGYITGQVIRVDGGLYPGKASLIRERNV